jgi:hypothetical protein
MTAREDSPDWAFVADVTGGALLINACFTLPCDHLAKIVPVPDYISTACSVRVSSSASEIYLAMELNCNMSTSLVSDVNVLPLVLALYGVQSQNSNVHASRTRTKQRPCS